MKTFYKILKALVILAAIAGIIYVIAVYGERIVAKANSFVNRARGKKDYYYDSDDNNCFCDDGDFNANTTNN